VEGKQVRVSSAEPGHGIGTRMIGWAIEESLRRGFRLVQLTSDSARTDAHRFYQRLGFTGSHVGFKIPL
jgi:GNAT superfamily N-acetyltransferase